ncbi:MAG TPA: type II secretion system protein [Rhodocyclaceae bacterium]|nr:type II secretion system protein [Rhodocyclaceae bacterium]
MSLNASRRGMALIEAIVFMLIVGIAAGTMLSVFANANRNSSDILINKQALSIAEALLAEVRSMPFTSLPPVGGESRSGMPAFSNITAYNNFAMGPAFAAPAITALDGVSMAGLAAYSTSISVAPFVPAGNNWNGVPSADIVLVTISVTHPTLSSPVVLETLRTRYAPAVTPGNGSLP